MSSISFPQSVLHILLSSCDVGLNATITVIPFDIPAIAGTDKFAVRIGLKLPANSGCFLVKFFSSVENLLN